VKKVHFPHLIRGLPDFEGPFDAHRLAADGCEVLFASYPAGTHIDTHTHDTHNVGIITAGQLKLTMDGEVTMHAAGEWYEVPANREHAASFDVDTSEIEFWFAAEK
jgi:quercetin dioxygenase-like cupin family protein